MNSPYFKLYRTYSNSFNSSNVGKFFWSWILRDCIKVQDKEKESHRLVFTFSTKREFRHFHIVIMQQRQINVQKSMMHKQSCCFANLKTLFFSRSCCRCHCHRLSSLLFYWILSFADICIVELFGRKLHFFIHGAVTFHFWKSSMEYSFYFMDICILKLGVYISFIRNHF